MNYPDEDRPGFDRESLDACSSAKKIFKSFHEKVKASYIHEMSRQVVALTLGLRLSPHIRCLTFMSAPYKEEPQSKLTWASADGSY